MFWPSFHLILRVLNEVKTLDNTEGAIKIYIPEKLGTLGPQDRKKNQNTICVGHHFTQNKHKNGVAEACRTH
jgi:hypothetical protein